MFSGVYEPIRDPGAMTFFGVGALVLSICVFGLTRAIYGGRPGFRALFQQRIWFVFALFGVGCLGAAALDLVGLAWLTTAAVLWSPLVGVFFLIMVATVFVGYERFFPWLPAPQVGTTTPPEIAGPGGRQPAAATVAQTEHQLKLDRIATLLLLGIAAALVAAIFLILRVNGVF
jgi:hypothetical protein